MMSLNFPSSRKNVQERIRADVRNELPSANPWLKNSFLGSLITGLAGRVFEFYLQLKNALLEMFPDTASGEFLERWGSYVSINRKAATQASGNVCFEGTVSSVIPAGTMVVSSEGLTYTTNSTSTIVTVTSSISSLTRSGSIATATTVGEHGYASGMTVTIAGAGQPEYNGSFVITVTSATAFTYNIAGSPVTPATGVISASAAFASVPVTSTGFGKKYNQISGTILTLSTPISGVNTNLFVPFSAISNGADQESDDDFRKRVIYRYQNPIALFNKNAIKQKALEVSGVTRVWVFGPDDSSYLVVPSSLTQAGGVATMTFSGSHLLETGQKITVSGASPSAYNGTFRILNVEATKIAYAVPSGTSSPATGTISVDVKLNPGQIKVFFMRDDDSPFPSVSAVTAVKNKILEIKPAHVADGDVIVLSPVPVYVNFNFTSLVPNTATMQEAIKNNLFALFEEEAQVGETIPMAAYLAAIWQTVDETGAKVQSFTLSTPTGDIIINPGQLGTTTSISFPS